MTPGDGTDDAGLGAAHDPEADPDAGLDAGPDAGPDAAGAVSTPEAAGRRLSSGSFSSGLSVPDFAACLAMGLEPVALVQGYCVMRWSWYGQSSQYMRGVDPYAGAGGGVYAETYSCPHGFVSGDHRTWGQNFEQTWIEAAWAQG